jgi:uncharacterized membrane protein
MFDWIPNLHPIVVHFPIALLIAAVASDVISLLTKGKTDGAATWLYVAGTAGLVAAYFSGRAAVDSLLIPAGAQAIQTDHADWALRTLILFAVLTVSRIVMIQLGRPSISVVRVLSVVVGLIGAGLITVTGDLGGRMVFGHGVGVSVPTDSAENDSAEVISGEGAGAVLGHAFSELKGDLSEAALVSDSTVLTLFLDRDELLFVTKEQYGSVQAEIELNLDRFKGRAAILYGFVSEGETDFVEFDQGTVEQGRRSNGELESFDQAVMTPSGWFTLTTVSDGSHFRGYVDGSMVVHGHGDAAPEGAVGLRLNGSGLIQMRGLSIQSVR